MSFDKKIFLSHIQELNDYSIHIGLSPNMTEASREEGIQRILSGFCTEDIEAHVSSPINKITGIAAWTGFWNELFMAFRNLVVDTYILKQGEYKGKEYMCAAGNLIGIFERDWYDIPCTHNCVWLRFSLHCRIEDGLIKEIFLFLDILDLMRQSGISLFPSKGIERIVPAPMTDDGIMSNPTNENQDEAVQKSNTLVTNMLNGLSAYDGKSLDSMGQERFWDEQQMMWYGPAGIGTTRGLQGFQQNHQIPFLLAFPDRGILDEEKYAGIAQFSEGNYTCHAGFPSMYATHTGDGWLGTVASGKKLTMRVMDIWRREGDTLIENWVMIDMIDVLEQMGYDIFKMMRDKKNPL